MTRVASRLWLSTIILLLAPFAAAEDSLDARDLRVLAGSSFEKQYEEMMQHYLLGLATEQAAKAHAALSAVRSEADLNRWQASLRSKFIEVLGGLPGEKTKLNARVTGQLDREGYTLRKIIFESRPEFFVTANLYIPAGKPPFPAILAPCGHSLQGKAYEVYQHLFIGLAKRGYVVLSYDPVGQGERKQFWDFVFPERNLVDKSNEHGLLGIRQYLLGQNLARDLVWDGLRGLDYLAALPDVDPSRIGVTGSSGGGTLTTYISLLDPRVKAASIVTFITSIPKKMEARDLDSEADPEQDIQGLLAAGIDHAELVAMIAPRPILIGAAVQDFFPIEGTRQTYAALEKLYGRLGNPDRMKMVEFDQKHAYSKPLREATTAWFDRWLKGQVDQIHEPEIKVEPESALWCTPTGQVVSSFGGKVLLDLHRMELDRLEPHRRNQRKSSSRNEFVERVRARLALPAARVAVRPRSLGETRKGSVTIEGVLLETEPNIVVPTRILHSDTQAAHRPAVVYFRDRDATGDDPRIFETLAHQGWEVVAADVRGFGETTPSRQVADPHIPCFHPRDGRDADFAYAALTLGHPLLGMRVWDALQVLAYTRSRLDVDPKRMVVIGRGWSGIIALFAAVLDEGVSRLVVEGVPASYAELFDSEMYALPASLILPGALQDFDLADMYAAFSPRPLLVLNPQDAQTKKMFEAETQAALAPARRKYQEANAGDHFEVATEAAASDVFKRIGSWVGAAK